MQELLTPLQQIVVKNEILDYLKTEKFLDQAKEENCAVTIDYLHNKLIRIIDKLTLNFPINRNWLLEQINYNSENQILKVGGPANFKNIS